jgi:hypothetical protein
MTMTEWERLKKHPVDTEANVGLVMNRLQRELDLFRLDVDLVAIERHRLDDGIVRWGILYDRELMGLGDTLVEATVDALSRSGFELS